MYLKQLSKLNFCKAILILKMKEKTQQLCIMLYYLRKIKMQLKQKKICAVYGQGTVTDQLFQKQFAPWLVWLSGFSIGL